MSLKILKEKLSVKTTWHTNELNSVINSLLVQETVGPSSDNEEFKNKMRSVDVLKKYDIIYTTTIGLAHYCIVHKIKDDLVYCIIISSKNKDFSLHKIEKDRYFFGNFFTKTYISFPLEDVKKRFVRVYENRIEADEVFKKVKQYYINLFK